MKAPDKIFVREFVEGLSQMWSSALATETSAIKQYEYIRAELAELTINDIAFIANTVWNMRVHNDGVSDNAIYEATLSQFNEQRQKNV